MFITYLISSYIISLVNSVEKLIKTIVYKYVYNYQQARKVR